MRRFSSAVTDIELTAMTAGMCFGTDADDAHRLVLGE
jgi:hypothetical protein